LGFIWLLFYCSSLGGCCFLLLVYFVFVVFGFHEAF